MKRSGGTPPTGNFLDDLGDLLSQSPMHEDTRDRIATIVTADEPGTVPQASEYVSPLIIREIRKEHVGAN
jgi:hypothetical protein